MTRTDAFYGLELLIVFLASPKDFSSFLTCPQHLKLCLHCPKWTLTRYI